MSERPKVGITLLVVKEIGGFPHVLLSQRRGSHGAYEYGTPGGHLEHGETFEETALRELEEECGTQIRVTPPEFLCVSNLQEYLPKHYVDIAMVSTWREGDPVHVEPDKSGPWGWYLIGELPAVLFASLSHAIEAYRTGRPYFG